jgi:hypothetical protein
MVRGLRLRLSSACKARELQQRAQHSVAVYGQLHGAFVTYPVQDKELCALMYMIFAVHVSINSCWMPLLLIMWTLDMICRAHIKYMLGDYVK